MKIKQINQLSDEELEKKLVDINKEIIKSTGANTGTGSKNIHLQRNYKKTIARIKTVQSIRKNKEK